MQPSESASLKIAFRNLRLPRYWSPLEPLSANAKNPKSLWHPECQLDGLAFIRKRRPCVGETSGPRVVCRQGGQNAMRSGGMFVHIRPSRAAARLGPTSSRSSRSGARLERLSGQRPLLRRVVAHHAGNSGGYSPGPSVAEARRAGAARRHVQRIRSAGARRHLPPEARCASCYFCLRIAMNPWPTKL